MKDQSDHDNALLRWSGELEGEAPEALQLELDDLARSVHRLPQELAPADAVAKGPRTSPASPAIHSLAHRSAHPLFHGCRHRGLRWSLVSAQRFLALRGTGFSPCHQGRISRPLLPLHLFPKGESPNLKRIRGARARILKLKKRRKPKPAANQTEHHSPPPALS